MIEGNKTELENQAIVSLWLLTLFFAIYSVYLNQVPQAIGGFLVSFFFFAWVIQRMKYHSLR